MNALQVAVFQRLTSDTALNGLIGGRVYDRAPLDAVFPYVSFGAADHVPDEADCIDLGSVTMQIDCWSRAQDGKRECNAIVDAVRRALRRFAATLTTGALCTASVVLVRVLDDPDGVTTHGVIQVECQVEDGS